MKKLTLGSLFDGSGGFPLGGLLAGIEPVWASEIEPFPIRVTTKRMPFMKHYGNVSEMDGSKVEPVDIITFGSPCQDMSVAGKRAGLDGSRSNLFYEAVRIVKEMRCATNGKYPRYIVWENVPGAFSSNKGEDFRCVLEAICQIKDETADVPKSEKWNPAGKIVGDNFSLAWRVLDAQFWGVPQRRKRIYLVADFNSECADKILFESEGVSGYSAESFGSWQRTACRTADCSGTPGSGFDGYNGSLTDDKSATLGVNCGMSTGRNGVVLNLFENHGQADRYRGPLDISPTLTASLKGGNNQPFVTENPAPGFSAGFCTEHSAKARSIGYEEEKSPTLRAGVVPAALCEPQLWNGDKVAPTLTTKNAGGNQRMPDIGNFNCVLQPFGISSKDSNAMKSPNPNSGIYEADTSRTLDKNCGNPSCNQGGIAVVCVDMGGGKSGCGISEGKTPTLACTHGGEPAICIQGSMIGRKDENGPQGDGINEDVSFTLNATDRHAVYSMTTGSFPNVAKDKVPPLLARDFKDATVVTEPSYGIGRDAFNQGANAQYKPCIEEEIQPTIVAKGPGAVAHPYGFDPSASRDVGKYFHEDCGNTLTNGSCPGHHNGVVENGYTVRRLTPTECARLQGFPDWWSSCLGTDHPTDEEVYFWYKVFKTYAEINGGKPKSDKQLRKWLTDPYSDSAEYKMWGNGVALPCVYFVLSGIVYYSQFNL